jgi:hypothetical protein
MQSQAICRQKKLLQEATGDFVVDSLGGLLGSIRRPLLLLDLRERGLAPHPDEQLRGEVLIPAAPVMHTLGQNQPNVAFVLHHSIGGVGTPAGFDGV